MLEIGFSHKIPRLNFVSYLKISQENLRKKIYDLIKHHLRNGDVLMSCALGSSLIIMRYCRCGFVSNTDLLSPFLKPMYSKLLSWLTSWVLSRFSHWLIEFVTALPDEVERPNWVVTKPTHNINVKSPNVHICFYVLWPFSLKSLGLINRIKIKLIYLLKISPFLFHVYPFIFLCI